MACFISCHFCIHYWRRSLFWSCHIVSSMLANVIGWQGGVYVNILPLIRFILSSITFCDHGALILLVHAKMCSPITSLMSLKWLIPLLLVSKFGHCCHLWIVWFISLCTYILLSILSVYPYIPLHIHMNCLLIYNIAQPVFFPYLEAWMFQSGNKYPLNIFTQLMFYFSQCLSEMLSFPFYLSLHYKKFLNIIYATVFC